MNEATKTQNEKHSTRFQKGSIPWNKGKNFSKKESQTKTIDDNTVKIHIVKEEKPLPPKDFEGKLEDVKERTAINFIRSIIANKPKCIDIDGQKYYREEIVGIISNKLRETRKLNSEAEEALNKCLDTMKDMADVANDMEKALQKVTFSRTCWRAIAIGLVIGTILVSILPSIFSKKDNKGSLEDKLTPTIEHAIK